MNMAATLPADPIRYAGRRVDNHTKWGVRVVSVGRLVGQLFGAFVDHCLSEIIDFGVRRLERDILFLRGVRATLITLSETNPGQIIDPDLTLIAVFQKLEPKIEEMRSASLDAMTAAKSLLPKTRSAYARIAESCATMHEVVQDVKWAISEHDSDAESQSKASLKAYEDAEQLIADLKA